MIIYLIYSYMNRLGILLIFEIELKYAVLLLNKANFAKLTKITLCNYFIQKLIKMEIMNKKFTFLN